MIDNKPIHRNANGEEYYLERAGGDERLIKKQGSVLPIIGGIAAATLTLLLGRR